MDEALKDKFRKAESALQDLEEALTITKIQDLDDDWLLMIDASLNTNHQLVLRILRTLYINK